MSIHLQEYSTLFQSSAFIADDLKALSDKTNTSITLSTSFSKEDQIISHIIWSKELNIDVFTLDTGRLFPETYSVWSRTLERYNKIIRTFQPHQEALENYVTEHGPNAFYNSVELRKSCCHIRKVLPLKRALQGYQIWLTGIRASQSPNRNNFSHVEWDDTNQIIKIHPLFFWTDEEVEQFILTNNIIYNSLHDKGFPSIGCAPCTRAVKPGEDPRAGRWWWEDQSKKECGLHQS